MPGKYARAYVGGKGSDQKMAQSYVGDNKRTVTDTRAKNKGSKGGKK